MKPIMIVLFLAAFGIFFAGCGGRAPEPGLAVRNSSSNEPATAPATAPDDRSSRMVLVEQWFEADSMFDELEVWRSRWQDQIKEASMIGGCDCHVALFRIRATQRAVDDLPKHDVQFQGNDSPN